MLEKLLEELNEELEQNLTSFYDEDGDYWDEGVTKDNIQEALSKVLKNYKVYKL